MTEKQKVDPVLELRDVSITFGEAQKLHAVEGLSFTVHGGEVLGLVGESGSGKSLTGFSIMGALDPPGRVSSGEIRFQGYDLGQLGAEDRRRLRGNRMAMIMQDPMQTLNPTLKIGTQIFEAIRAHRAVTRKKARDEAIAALQKVGIGDAAQRLEMYPHEFSGGMRQRVAIAIALLHDPDLIIADEPTTALDVTVQAQILLEVRELVHQTGAALIWISHDLSVVAGLADRVVVMYAGRIVEIGSTEAVLRTPRHPYTQGLLRSDPETQTLANGRLWHIPGSAPTLAERGKGCAFRPRCGFADQACYQAPDPQGTDHQVSCWYPRDAETP